MMDMIDPSQLNWPDPTDDITDPDLKKMLYQAKLAVVTDQLAALTHRDKAARANYDTLTQAVFNAYLEVAKGQLDRATLRAEFVEKAAGTIATLYTGILAFTYSVDVSKGRPFPLIGIAPTFFLGVSIVLAMFYVGYISQSEPFRETASSGLLAQQIIDERNDFIRWTIEGVLKRAPWLQSAVISLGFGIIFLPVSYLSLSVPELYLWSAVAVSAVYLLLRLIILLRSRPV